MKKAIIGGGLLIIVLGVAPAVVGRLAESRAQDLLAAFDGQSPQFRVVGQDWQRGWFSSRQRLALEYAPPVVGAKPLQLTVLNDVWHGPVLGLSGLGIARVRSDVELPPEARAKLRELFGGEDALDVVTRIGFTGGGSTLVRSRGRALRPAGGEVEQVIYDDFRMKVGFDRRFTHYELDGKLPRVEVRDGAGGRLLLDRLTFEGEGRREGDYRFLGDSSFEMRLRGLELTDGNGQAYKVANVRYAAGFSFDAGEGFAGMDIELGSGAVEGGVLGPSGLLQVRSIDFDVALGHLHAPTMEAIYHELANAYATPSADAEGAGGAAAPPLADAMSLHVASLLAHDPELHFDRVGFATPEGEAVLKGVVYTKGVQAQDFQVLGMLAVVAALEADLTFEITQALAEKLPNGATFAGAGLDNGLLVREGGKLVSRIGYHGGRLVVNGQPQGLPGPGLPGPGSPFGDRLP